MKVLFLNAWGAEVRDPLSQFIARNVFDTDVFCFQEADRAMPALCEKLLGGYRKITAHKFVGETDNFYQAIYIKEALPVISSGEILGDEEDTGLGVYVEIAAGDGSLHICNFHGVSRPVDKHDTSARVRQVQGLIEFFGEKAGPKVIGGDFNVFPSNESLKLFQKEGYRDLIQEYKITNTRNRLVWERYPNNERQFFSDYAFVSNDIDINTFTVPDIEVSDHLPLVIDLSLQNSLSAATPFILPNSPAITA